MTAEGIVMRLFIHAAIPSFGGAGIQFTSGIVKIDEMAFDECSGLKSVAIPESVKIVGECAFGNCPTENIVFPRGLISIELGAFFGCEELTEIVLPNQLKYIGEAVFASCSRLRSVVIPKSVEEMGIALFFDCESLETVKIENENVIIKDDAFYYHDKVIWV